MAEPAANAMPGTRQRRCTRGWAETNGEMAKRKSTPPAVVIEAAEAMGAAVGKAMAALESVSRRRQRAVRATGRANETACRRHRRPPKRTSRKRARKHAVKR